MKKNYQSLKGFYKGYWCDSVWELAYIVYNLDHNIKFHRNKKGFPYLWYGKQHYYYPDFVLEDGTFVEIKGVKLGKDARKISKFPYKLIVLYYDDIKPYMMYLKTKYGSDPTKIYDKYIYDSFTR